MKLGELKRAIIKMEGAPRIFVALPDTGVGLHLQKTPLIAELTATFSEGKNQETGLWLRDDGFIMKERDRATRTDGSSGTTPGMG